MMGRGDHMSNRIAIYNGSWGKYILQEQVAVCLLLCLLYFLLKLIMQDIKHDNATLLVIIASFNELIMP